MTVPDLLTELRIRDVRLSAAGDKLRVNAPLGVLTADLAERVKAHKAELLAALAAGRAPVGSHTPSIPHELSLAERVESRYVNAGWAPKAWAARLRQLADRCEALRPDLAATYRSWAAKVGKRMKNQKGLA